MFLYRAEEFAFNCGLSIAKYEHQLLAMKNKMSMTQNSYRIASTWITMLATQTSNTTLTTETESQTASVKCHKKSQIL